MSTAVITTEHHLTQKDIDLAAEIETLDSELDKTMITICLKTAEGCEGKGNKSQDAFLSTALPKRVKGTRKNILYAGMELVARQRAIEELGYGWSILTEIHALSELDKSWAYEKRRTQKEVREKLQKKRRGQKPPAITPEVVTDEQEEETDVTNFINNLDELFTTPTENNGRHQPELHQQPGRLVHLGSDRASDSGGDLDDTLSQHWADVQNSNEPDSYKQAQYFLSQFELQLQKGFRDGWSQSAYETLWRDLSSYTKSCGSCSREYREQLDERTEEARARIENPVPGGEDILEASGS